ncbi:MAG: hypothetical protein IPM06_21030 [Rhizobiales bacterium]|nr:hypothetical protein [Hyphomicrobiales bacterium]
MFSTAQPAPQFANNRTAFDMTAQDFSDQMGPVAGSGHLFIQFTYQRVKLVDGTWSTRLMVIKQPRGDRSTVVMRYVTESAAAQQWPVEFAQFKSTGDVPTTGTPLSDLPGISMAQIGLLYVNGIRSIEDLVSIAPEVINGMGLDAIHAYKVAKRWTDTKSGSADLTEDAKREAALEQTLMETRRQLDESNRSQIEMAAQLKLMQQLGVQMQGQMAPGMVAAASLAGNAIAVNGEEIVPQAGGSDIFAEGGGMAGDNSDLGLDQTPTQDNPLGLGGGRSKRG